MMLPGSAATTFRMVAVVLAASALVASLVAWRRSRQGSADRRLAPVTLLLTAAILVGTVPVLVLPGNETVQMVSALGSFLLTILSMVQLARVTRGSKAA